MHAVDTYQLILVGGDRSEGGFRKDERFHVVLWMRCFSDLFVINNLCSSARLHQVNTRLVFVHRIQNNLHTHNMTIIIFKHMSSSPHYRCMTWLISGDAACIKLQFTEHMLKVSKWKINFKIWHLYCISLHRRSNSKLWKKSGKEPVQEQLKRTRWNWLGLGHTNRRSDDSIAKQAL